MFFSGGKSSSDVISFAIIDYNDHDTEAGEKYKNIGTDAAKNSNW